MTLDFTAIDFETAAPARSSVCAVALAARVGADDVAGLGAVVPGAHPRPARAWR